MTRLGSCCWRKFRSLRLEALRSALIPQTRCDKGLLWQAGERQSRRTMITTAKGILLPASTFTIRKCSPCPICSLWVYQKMKKTGMTYIVVLVGGSVVGSSNFFTLDHRYPYG